VIKRTKIDLKGGSTGGLPIFLSNQDCSTWPTSSYGSCDIENFQAEAGRHWHQRRRGATFASEEEAKLVLGLLGTDSKGGE
jgi:hypothetical protein